MSGLEKERAPATGWKSAAMSKYASPGAFRTALSAKLRTLSESSPWTVPQLRRQFAYDRLLERLYMLDDGWVIKGAVALIARDIGVRASLDIDVYRAKAADAAEADLRQATARDIGDWFRFEIGPRQTVGEGSKAVRFAVVAYIGARSGSASGSIWSGRTCAWWVAR